MSSGIGGYYEALRLIHNNLDGLLVDMEAQMRGHKPPPVSTPRWEFPVVPPEAWYCASLHDTTGKLNNGYGYTGIDLNLDRSPWGDVDRGQHIFAVTDGVIDKLDWHARYLACVLELAEHEGKPLYIRYWHLANDDAFKSWSVGDSVKAGSLIGNIGDYVGGDHLHFDMALDPFEPQWWFTNHPSVRWIDPLEVLKAHLTPSEVDLMVGRRDG